MLVYGFSSTFFRETSFSKTTNEKKRTKISSRFAQKKMKGEQHHTLSGPEGSAS
jgi:hypothetical protein